MFGSLFSNSFQTKWYLYPTKYPKNSNNNYSSKVLLPYYVLEDLAAYNYQAPFVFEISHKNGVYKTVCSVLDFSQDEVDQIFLPSWMFEQLCLDESEEVVLKHTVIDYGEGITLLPHNVDFLEIENPKKELENTLQNYHVLSYGDEILLYFDEIGKCRFTVTKIIPEHLDTIYIVDTDLGVDFEEPLGYKEKVENEKSIMKYVKIGDEKSDIKSLNLTKIGVFIDWDNLKLEE